MAEQVVFVKVGSTTDTLIPVEAVAVVPGTTSRDTEARYQVTSGIVMTVLLPPGSQWLPDGMTVTERDYMQVRGREYAIEGRPTEWVSPYGGPGGYEVLLRAATG